MKEKLGKKVCSCIIASVITITIFIPHGNVTSAATSTTPDKSSNVADAKFVNDFRTVKKKVKKYKQWSKFKRASDDMKTKNYTGSITCDRTVSWSGSAEGDLSGITYSIGKTKETSVGYKFSP